MTAVVLAGALLGAALWFLAWTLIPARTDHTVTLARLDTARAGTTRRPPIVRTTVGPQAPGSTTSQLQRLRLRCGTVAAAWLQRRGLALTRLRQNLALLDRSLDEHLGALLGVAVATFFGTLIAGGLLLRVGFPLPGEFLLPLTVVIAAAATAARHHDVATAAEQRRRQFRRALSAYLELVARSLMGGTGVPEALPAAANIGTGWPFRLVSETLDRARAIGTSAWGELGALGEHIGVDELRDLATALALVGQDGARIAATLVARASTLRRREIADIDGRAKERDTSMRMAMVVVSFGFLLFLLYPAVTNILHQ